MMDDGCIMSHGVALNGCVRLQGWMTMRCELSLKCMPLDLGLMDELAERDASGEGRESGVGAGVQRVLVCRCCCGGGGGGAELGREGFRPLQSPAVRPQ